MSRRRKVEQGDGRRHDRNRVRDRKSVTPLALNASGIVNTSHDANDSASDASDSLHKVNDSIIAGGYLERDHSKNDDNLGSKEDYRRHKEDNPDPVTSGGQTPSGDADYGHEDDAYRFDLVNGQVANVRQFDNGRWKSERIDSDEAWSFDGTNLVMTEREHYGNQIKTFTDPNGDGIFTILTAVQTSI